MSNIRYNDEIERLEREREALLTSLSPEEKAEYDRVRENFSQSAQAGSEPASDSTFNNL